MLVSENYLPDSYLLFSWFVSLQLSISMPFLFNIKLNLLALVLLYGYCLIVFYTYVFECLDEDEKYVLLTQTYLLASSF